MLDLLSRSPFVAPTLKWFGILALLVGLTAALGVILRDPDSAPHRYFREYVAHLDRKLKVLFIWTPGSKIAAAQIAAATAVILLALVVGLPNGEFMFALIVLGPGIVLERMRTRRILAIEEQLDGFLLAIANALKATPSLGDAFASTTGLIARPLQQEIELAVKEMRLGSTLADALKLMATRIGSRRVDSALSALLIGRKVGGDLPKVLETSAATLRELARLEGVVRAKTSEGKSQLVVLAAMPAVIVVAFDAMSPGYFKPLTQSAVGYAFIAVAVLLWLGAIVTARKILSVEV